MQDSSDCLLLIFIKNPEKGTVKTRLAATLGDKKALSIYGKLLKHTREVAQSVQSDKQLWYSQFVPKSDVWSENDFDKKLQQGRNLGERMKYSFRQAFENGYKKAVIIGSDCAQLQKVHLENAFDALEKAEMVIGPAEDGGYYLLGMRQSAVNEKNILSNIFDDKPWGSSGVLQQTISDCEKMGISLKLLEKLNDVDTEEDWNQIKNKF